MAYAHEAFASNTVQRQFKKLTELFLGPPTSWGHMKNTLIDLIVSKNLNYVIRMQLVVFFFFTMVYQRMTHSNFLRPATHIATRLTVAPWSVFGALFQVTQSREH